MIFPSCSLIPHKMSDEAEIKPAKHVKPLYKKKCFVPHMCAYMCNIVLRFAIFTGKSAE